METTPNSNHTEFKAFFLIVFILNFICPSAAEAQSADTTAYQAQRLKVNALLAQRSAKFGQYDQSLTQHTGIFGFQSKQDVKNSNEILRQIVINDNNIFKELKILMDYKELIVQQVKRDASSSNSRLQNYQATIRKLQEENERLQKAQQGIRLQRTLAVSASIVFLVILVVMFIQRTRNHRLVPGQLNKDQYD